MIKDYSEHRPHTLIYQNKQIVPSGEGKANSALLLGVANLLLEQGIEDAAMTKFVQSGSTLGPSDGTFVELTSTNVDLRLLSSNTLPYNLKRDEDSNGDELNFIQPEIGSDGDLSYSEDPSWSASYPEMSDSFNLKIVDTSSVKAFYVPIETSGDQSTWSPCTVSTPTYGDTYVTLSLDVSKKNTHYIVVYGDFNLQTKEDSDLTLVTSSAAAANYFGRGHIKRNPIGFACSIASVAGSGEQYFVDLLTPSAPEEDSNGDVLVDYFNVQLPTSSQLTKWSTVSGVQFIAPICNNATSGSYSLFQQLEQNVITCSTPDSQRWRRVYLPSQVSVGGSASVVTSGVSQESSAYSSDRVINVFCDSPQCVVSSSGVLTTYELPLPYVAGGLAVYRSSILPQQGMSMQNLPWIYACPKMYTKYSVSQLDKMGSFGTFIIVQEDRYDDVHVRHALTTDSSNGILYYEDMVGVNVDDISYGIKNIIKPFIGKRNNTNETLMEIRNRISDYLSEIASTGLSIEERQIGPQIKSYDKNTFSVELDENLKDRVVVNVDVEVPLPINTIVVHINAFESLT